MPGVPPQGFPSYGGYPPPPSGYPGQPQPYGAHAVDPQAPFGRDPATGQPLSDKSAVVAGLLQLFLGGFGIGRFYIGSTTIGAIQLTLGVLGILTSILIVGFFLLFAVGIWALVDAIMMFSRSIPDRYGRKLRS
ncbi:TM2 domain-containing protein [Mycolicibacterium mageritense]|uniref:TM2 domain-containing protein n=1 Tax=Mycolicibacterium mageritense TaxID=53462 RepID=A0ABM7HLF6_MYCME|nr:TM2 domain-containing protein [Mycolicibacterium mageritense]MCC9182449.1 TM2 domain-containing protein [Mycolicibacterium mageritense]BBX31324.1 hypothetical protein MMAGJ_06060 [Mycolicibacterium mageritense]